MHNKLSCPRCSTQLLPETVEDSYFNPVNLLECPSCNGQWFQEEQLECLAKNHEPILIEFRKIPSPKEQLIPMQCPSCESKPIMEKIAHDRDKNVIIDLCPECYGVWLDGGELKAIREEGIFLLLGKLYKWVFSQVRNGLN